MMSMCNHIMWKISYFGRATDPELGLLAVSICLNAAIALLAPAGAALPWNRAKST